MQPQPPAQPLPEVVLPPASRPPRSPARSCRPARSAAPDRADRPAAPGSIRSSSERVSAGVSTGVAPFVTTCFGPRTAAARFTGRTWLTRSQSPSMRIAATCCFDRGRCFGLGPDPRLRRWVCGCCHPRYSPCVGSGPLTAVPDTIGASRRDASCYHFILGSHHMADDNLQSEIERLKAENERLKSDRGRTVSLKVSAKGRRVGLWSRSLSSHAL